MEKSRICAAPDQIASGKFLSLQRLHYTASDGKEHLWESVSRVNSSGAVLILAELVPSGRIVLIRQFRPPAGAYVWEFPAGLLEPGEEAAETAVRELYEETGYHGTVTACSEPVFSSPGLSSETIRIARMKIQEKGQEHPVPAFDGTEYIETFAVSPADIPALIKKAVEAGDVVDAKVEMLLQMEAFLKKF